MTEWRRTLRSWPKETPTPAALASLPAWVEVAGRARREEPERRRAHRRWGVFLGVGLIYLMVVQLMPFSPLMWTLLGGAVVGAVALGYGLGLSQERAEARRRDRAGDRAAALGEPTLGGEFVSVGYADGCWTYPDLGEGADEGFLRLDMDRLVFAGRDTQFEIPADAILGTEVGRHETGLGVRARLYVHWAHGGQAGTVSLSLAYRRSLRRRVQEATDLRERIERWRGETILRRPTPAVLPPIWTPTETVDPYLRVGLRAKVLAGISTFVALVVVMVALEIGLTILGYREIARGAGSGIGGTFVPGLLVWLWLARKIEARLPLQHRYQEPAILPDLGAARVEDEAVRQRA